MRGLFRLIPLIALPCTLIAQQPATKAVTPAGWVVRADVPDADEPPLNMSKLSFTPMNRGWHVTTGPIHAIFYRPATTATGNYTAVLDSYFFGPPGQYPEGYGIFIGGKDLTGANQAYVYFVAANNGKFLIKKRSGTATPVLVDWKPAAAIKTVPAGSKGNVENVFKVEARTDAVVFSVNNSVVATLPRNEVPADGVVGFRINHDLSVHVASLTVTKP